MAFLAPQCGILPAPLHQLCPSQGSRSWVCCEGLQACLRTGVSARREAHGPLTWSCSSKAQTPRDARFRDQHDLRGHIDENIFDRSTGALAERSGIQDRSSFFKTSSSLLEKSNLASDQLVVPAPMKHAGIPIPSRRAAGSAVGVKCRRDGGDCVYQALACGLIAGE